LVFTEEDLRVVSDTYRSGWLTMGPRTEAFEESFAEYVGARYAVAVTNGTAALHLMCLASGLTAGDEVIVPSLTFVATANAVAYEGAVPVFADVLSLAEPWLSPEQCSQRITDRTRAILYVDYGGHPGAIEQLRDLCLEYRLTLLEDAAHAAGSRYRGRHVGTFGLAGAFSLFSTKNLAVGEGGVVVTNDAEVAARVRLLRSHGMTAPTWDRHRGHASGYDVVARGFNYRIDEVRAGLATSRLRRLDQENLVRASIGERYRESLQDLDLIIAMQPAEGVISSHHLFTVVLPEDIDRETFRDALARQGIQTSVHYPPLHRTTLYQADVALCVTEEYGAHSVSLPLFAHMSEEQQELVISAVRNAVRARSKTTT